ncbi:cryptochrome/photolyase family protein [Streptomyces thermolilacinus]|uniref:Deoxyribodipyrimidine photolyase n=1 Tax=Streptomyces thermolilacinus SPC6 TaxID=1306406 RepID=A0A1D3DN47_9ACTN|nr:deoxyribodipyrimidine photo-lyase [Streptomyces thermolilacinus]OEJ93754.1 deoxyribodipyrimidine photolyase [Streptomyces thermolilacinus SPC6]
MTTAVVLFTCDLRLHDHPPLRAALRAHDTVVPLFVRDEGVAAAGFAAPNRAAFLADCLADLDAGLRRRGGRLVVRSGRVADVVCAVAAETGAAEVHMAADHSGYAQRREDLLRTALAGERRALRVHDAVGTVVPPGAIAPRGAAHYAVFGAYHRRWTAERVRGPLTAPRAVPVPDGVRSEEPPSRQGVAGVSPGLTRGGETEGRRRLAAWLGGPLDAYADQQDDLAADGTSRLSPYLHFGAVSATEAVHRARARGGPGADAFVRQLCWRDFHRQLLAARPSAAHDDYRTRHDRWRTGPGAEADAEAWKAGRTGYPVVDATMRQLAREGWAHNRGRLIAASFLTKTLYVDWRVGARHFLELLADGDIPNNQLNWQWVAGTGTDSRPNRVLNPVAQGRRYDPDGVYVRRWVPELARVGGPSVHEPWKPSVRAQAPAYPPPIVDLPQALSRFRTARGLT